MKYLRYRMPDRCNSENSHLLASHLSTHQNIHVPKCRTIAIQILLKFKTALKYCSGTATNIWQICLLSTTVPYLTLLLCCALDLLTTLLINDIITVSASRGAFISFGALNRFQYPLGWCVFLSQVAMLVVRSALPLQVTVE